jgi:multiple PDZ domain protein
MELNVVLQPDPNLVVDVVRNPQPIGAAPSLPILAMDMMPLPEMEKFTVELKKDYHGLGITIAGYVCEKGEIFSHLNYVIKSESLHIAEQL